MINRLTLLICVILQPITVVSAQQIDTTSEEIDFFSEVDVQEEVTTHNRWKGDFINGNLTQEIGYNTQGSDPGFYTTRDSAGITKLRTTLNLKTTRRFSPKWDYRISIQGFYDTFYWLDDADSTTPEQREAFKSRLELTESYLRRSIGKNWNLTFGRQIIAWGQSEITPVVDVINPRDVSELMQTDLEDMRLPVGSANISFIDGPRSAELIYVFEPRGDRTGVKGSEFDPYIRIRPRWGVDNPRTPNGISDGGEIFFRVRSYIPKGELALIFGNGYANSPVLRFDTARNRLVPEYDRFQLAGASTNLTVQQWLFKAEVAYMRNLAQQRIDIAQQFLSGATSIRSWEERDVIQSLLGIDYYGLWDIDITLEWSNTYIKDHSKSLATARNENNYAIFLRRTWLNDRLTGELSWFHLGNDNGDIARLNLDFELSDAIHLTAAYYQYTASRADARLYPYRRNDRLVLGARYYF